MTPPAAALGLALALFGAGPVEAAVASPSPQQPQQPQQPPASPELVDATKVVDGLALDIRYATENNFTGKKLYDAARCLLRPRVAAGLAQAQALLKPKGYGLKVFDCYRPFSVQKKMWEAMPVRGLVAPPAKGGSNHNRGAAVDITLIKLDGSAVEMPTEYDDFGRAARINSPLPSKAAQRHRTILQDAMMRSGFKPMYMEWWHFDAEDPLQYKTLDLPLTPAE
ncbi:MAG TPA: M15 family metallopeptidase [Myxococcales bacterium]